MNDISKEYIVLFQAISQATKALTELQWQLQQAQVQAEALYIQGESNLCPENAK